MPLKEPRIWCRKPVSPEATLSLPFWIGEIHRARCWTLQQPRGFLVRGPRLCCLPSNHLLKPKTPTKDMHKKKKSKQTKYYNQSVKELPELIPGDIVQVQPLKSMDRYKQWAWAEVDTKVDIRSYQVRTEDGRVLRCNRRHLKHTKEVPHLQEPAERELLETLPSFTDQQVTRHPLLQPSSARNPEPAPDKQIIPVLKLEPTKQVAPQTTTPSATRTHSDCPIKMPVLLNNYVT